MARCHGWTLVQLTGAAASLCLTVSVLYGSGLGGIDRFERMSTDDSPEEEPSLAEEESSQLRQHGGSGHRLEIWSRTSAGTYLWRDILEGSTDIASGGALSTGQLEINGWSLRFVTGHDIHPSYISADTEYLLLALNGRSDATLATTQDWLQQVSNLPRLKGLGLLLIGHESCRNDWLKTELVSNGGRLHFVLLIYDSDIVDGRHVFQWPLGVAAYRDFPFVKLTVEKLAEPRPYIFNFVGTVYPRSSRQKLVDVLKKEGLTGGRYFVRTRADWVAHESPSSMYRYQRALHGSDLTLCPVGKNSESYRLYEACSMGSVPVVEDRSTDDHCVVPLFPRDILPLRGTTSTSSLVPAPYRLLKRLNAPFIFIKDWSELPALVAKEKAMTLQQIIKRRKALFDWYKSFKANLFDGFFSVLNQTLPSE